MVDEYRMRIVWVCVEFDEGMRLVYVCKFVSVLGVIVWKI